MTEPMPPTDAAAPETAAPNTAPPGPATGRRARSAAALIRHETEAAAAQGVGLFALLRQLERHGADRPRIGRNTRLRDALVRLGQDPFLAFPASDLARLDDGARAPRVRAQFLGLFGAFGALPLNWTEEVRRWFDAGDESFVAFTDIFVARFQELFFRAWSDAQPITQFDHPDDRFQTWLMALLGTGTPALRGRGTLSDTVRLRLAPLALGRVKSPVRLRQMLQLHFDGTARVSIEEMLPSWLEFEPDARSQLGLQCSLLGRDMHLGERVQALGQKIRIHLHLDANSAYDRFLPGGPDHADLRDIVFWYLGQRFEVETALWLPHPELRPAQLGRTGTLGWMACLAPEAGDDRRAPVRVTVFRLEPPEPPAAPECDKAA